MKKSLIVLLMVLLIICGCEKKEAPHTDNGEKQVMPPVPEKYIGAFYRDAGKNHYTLFLRGDNTFRLLVGNDIYVSRVGTYDKNGNVFELHVAALYNETNHCYYTNDSEAYQNTLKTLKATLNEENNTILIEDFVPFELDYANGVYEVDETISRYSIPPIDNDIYKVCESGTIE